MNFIIIITIFLFIFFIFLQIKNIILQINFNKKYSLLKTNKFFYIKNIVLVFSLFCLLLNIFWFSYNWLISYSNSWKNIIFCLDVSQSMNVYDISDWNYNYSRLDVAKNSIKNFVTNNPNNKFWLVLFSWESTWVLPLTDDIDIFLTILASVNNENLTKQWTDFYSAIKTSVSRFLSMDENNSNIVVILTDWWDDDTIIDKQQIQNLLGGKNIQFTIWWVWTLEWWKIVTWQDFFWRDFYKQYQWSDLVLKLSKNNITKIWEYLSGNTFFIEKLDEMNIMEKVISKFPNSNIKKTHYADISYSRELWKISFILFLLYLFLYFFEDKIYNLTFLKWTKK